MRDQILQEVMGCSWDVDGLEEDDDGPNSLMVYEGMAAEDGNEE